MLFHSCFHLTGKKVQVDVFLTKTTQNILIDNNNIPMCFTFTGYLNKKKKRGVAYTGAHTAPPTLLHWTDCENL